MQPASRKAHVFPSENMYLRKPGEATGKDLLLVYLKNSKVKMNDDDAGSEEDI